MKFFKQSATLMPDPKNVLELMKIIELAGRTCYQSESKITEDSYDQFVTNLINSRHNSVLEHGTVYLKYIDNDEPTSAKQFMTSDFLHNPYTIVRQVTIKEDNYVYITTNYRVIIENNWNRYLKYICEPTEMHAKRYVFSLVTNRQIANEFERHRKLSFSQESTRYCNYSNEKFGGELKFIIPNWSTEITEGTYELDRDRQIMNVDTGKVILGHTAEGVFIQHLDSVERAYRALTNKPFNLVAQEASTILPLDTKTSLIISGFESDFNDFFNLRYHGFTGAPHPMAKELAGMMMDQLRLQ